MRELDTKHTKVFFGRNSLEKVSDITAQFSPKKILLVTGSRAMKRYGVIDRMKEYLSSYNIILFSEVESNPAIETVERLVGSVKDSGIDLIIGLGGGSVIDVAKSTSILIRNNTPLREILRNEEGIVNKGLPFIAIPTTAGTGSEITRWATIWDRENKKKLSLIHEYMYPKIALLDPSLTLSLPGHLTAITGIDALSHAIEAYWSIYSNPDSDQHALQAISLINVYLEKIYNDLKNIDYREKMLWASLQSGLAFTQTKTTAVHSVSYPITAYFNVPHSMACGILLPAFIEYNYEVSKEDCVDKRGYKFVRGKLVEIARGLGCDSVSEATQRIRELLRNLDLPIYLRDVNVTDLELVVENAYTPDRMGNNPRLVKKNKLRIILNNIYEEKS
jgi:phosphonate metabolism-associated iron-containing alcohol dehydrogenase